MRRLLCTALCLAALIQPLTAEPDGVARRPYTLDACIRIGLERSPVAARAALDERIAATQVGQARSEALPRIGLNGTYTRADELQTVDFGGVQMELGTLDSYSVGAGLNQLLYSGGRVGAALHAAKLSETLAASARRSQELGLIRDIRISFHGLLLAQEQIRVEQASVDQLAALVAETESKLKQGTVSEFDLLTARVRLANEKPVLIAARNLEAVGREAFQHMLKLEDPSFAVTGRLEYVEWLPDADAMLRIALQQRSELQQAADAVELSRDAESAAGSGYLPTLGAFANYTGANTYGFGGGNADLEWHWNAGLSVSWNLWDGDLTRQTVRQKRLEREKREIDLDDLRSAIRLDVRQAALELVHARERVLAGRDTVQMAEDALRIAATRYAAGLATQLEYADANLALSRARLGYGAAVAAHMDAVARLEFACGMERPGWAVGAERSAAR